MHLFPLFVTKMFNGVKAISPEGKGGLTEGKKGKMRDRKEEKERGNRT